MRIISLIFALLLPLTLLTACGFEAVHAKGDSTLNSKYHAALNNIAVEVANQDRSGQLFRIALEDTLHPDNHYAAPKYNLRTTLEEIKQPLIIERDASITRFNLVLKARYSLTEIATGTKVKDKLSQRISSYNVSESDFATFEAERNARERGIEELARKIKMEIITSLRGKR